MPNERFDFLTKEKLLDKLKTERSPSPEVADVLAAILRDEASARFFYHDLDNEAWLVPLGQRGVFNRAPSPIPHEGGWRFPPWPAAGYLRRVAAKQPSDVAAILRRVESDNPVACSELAEALWAMPPAIAARLVPAVLRWLELPFDFLLPQRTTGLIRHLVRGEQVGAALKLLDALIEPDFPEVKDAHPHYKPDVRPRRDQYQVEQLLKEVGELFPPTALGRVLPIIERRLKQALKWEEEGSTSRSDFSSLWRSAVEDHEQNRVGGYKTQLVSALRDILEQLPNSSQRLSATLKRYARSRRSIFRRLALHRARLGGRTLQRLRRDLLLDPQLDSDLDCHHELYLLRSQCFTDLSRREQRVSLDRLSAPPTRRRGEDEAEFRQRAQAMFIRALSAIEKWLPRDVKQRYDAIVREQGKPEHPDFLMYSSGGWVSITGPKRADELSQMPVRDIVLFLETWRPERGRTLLTEVSRLGLARELQSAIHKTPQPYIEEIELFAAPGLHGLYVQHLLDGIREAVKDGATIHWETVISFCEQLLTSDFKRFDLTGDPENESRASWVVSAVASLLEEAYKLKERAPGKHLWDRTERILEVLTSDPEPDEEHEATYGGSNMDPFTLSLNTARGRAMHAVFSLVRHIALAEAQATDQTPGPLQPRALRPATRVLLETKLDKANDSSEAVHSVFGVSLPLLLYADRDWTLQALPAIFPTEARYWWAAFESYIMYGQFQAPIYKLLESQYRRAIDEARLTRPKRSRVLTFEEQLGKHLALVFWHGLEDISDPESNLAAFFEESSDEARSSFVWLIWRALQEVKPDVNSDQWQRCRALWQRRVAAAQASGEAEHFRREMESYAWWLNETPEDIRSMKGLIQGIVPYFDRSTHAGDVIEYLDRQVEVDQAAVTDVLRNLIEFGRELYLLSEHRARIRHILTAALASGKPDAEAHALAIINHYERVGHFGYRDLVD